MIFHTLETVRYYMAKAKTKKGLKVKVSILDKVYETGRKYAAGFKKTMKIVFDEFLPSGTIGLFPSQCEIGKLFPARSYGGDPTQRFNVFDFTMSRSRDGPRDFLKGYQSYLQADAFGGYDGTYTDGQVVEVGGAYARRKFIEAQKTDLGRRPRAGFLS